MAGSHEKLNQAEQTAHVPYRHIGLTTALIGVLIALCAAMVGSHRNALVRAKERRGGPSVDSAGEAQLPLSKRFLRLYLDYSMERDFAKTWVDSYQPVIDTHFSAAHSYENAQLVAEIAIVIALIAILFSNRPAWLISILLAVICIGMLTSTWLNTGPAVARTLANIRKSEYAYQQLRKAHLAANQDERTVEEIVKKYRSHCGLPERPLYPL